MLVPAPAQDTSQPLQSWSLTMHSIRIAIASITLAAAGLAQAQEVTTFAASTSVLDRAAVLAETRRALAEDRLVWGTEGSEEVRIVASRLDRATVQREAGKRMSSVELLQYHLTYGM
jgi:hypothetical protein